MSKLQDQRQQGVFRPIDNLQSANLPTFKASITSNIAFAIMVNEREPPRDGNSLKEAHGPLQDRPNAPEFGKASPMRNPLHKASAGIFNIPKPGQRRPEHHRAPSSHSSNAAPTHPSASRPPPTQASRPFSNTPQPQQSPPSIISVSSSSPDFVEISRPTNFPPAPIHAAPRPMFSTSQAVPPANFFKLTHPSAAGSTAASSHDGFNPDSIDRGGSFDPSNFMDAAQANENIKALLEGAFDEDDDDKPHTRLRKRKEKDQRSSEALTSRLQDLKAQETQLPTNNPQDIEQDDDDDGVVEGLKVKLLPHQIDGVAWMLDKEVGTRKKNGVLPKGGILADDMGLGKTIQALALILSNRCPSPSEIASNPKSKVPSSASKTTLVVAPLALLKQWESEIKDKVLPSVGLTVLVHHGPSRTKRYEDLKKQDIVITTYQTLASEHEMSNSGSSSQLDGFFGIHWYRVILDEAHSIKNRNAKMTKAAYALNSVFRWCLTGTPLQNNLEELQSLIRFLDIKPYNDVKTWKAQIRDPMNKGRGGLAMKRLQYFLKAFMKRRTKDILKKDGALTFGKTGSTQDPSTKDGFKIVARQIQSVVVQFSPFEHEFYQNLEARTNKNLAAIMESGKNDYIGALVLLLRLRQACNHPELSRGNLAKEKESFASATLDGTASQRGSPSKSSSRVDDVDGVADLLGGMTVQTKKCDTCGSNLSKEEMSSGAIRCRDCDDDFDKLRQQVQPKTRNEKKTSRHAERQKRGFRSRRILESDDEEEDDDNDDAEVGGSADSDEGNESDSELSHHNGHQQRQSTKNQVISAKIQQLVKILEEESDEHKFIVFSEFTSMLDLVEPFLEQHGFRFARYDGKMKNDDREASLHRLRNDSRTRILLCSLRCGSLGLNLTAANRVVIMEPFWNPFVEEQAIDRVHRLNQTKDVVVYRLTIANTVEDRILSLQEKKRELANAAVEGGKAVGKLSMDDIMRLFKRDAEHEDRYEDNTIQGIGSGTTGGVLRGNTPKQQPSAPVPTSRQTAQQSPSRNKDKQRPKFQIPENLRSEYEALYGRRW